MKSPDGLIWNTPSRRKRFTREYYDLKSAEIDHFLEQWEALEAQEQEVPEVPPLRLVKG